MLLIKKILKEVSEICNSAEKLKTSLLDLQDHSRALYSKYKVKSLEEYGSEWLSYLDKSKFPFALFAAFVIVRCQLP